MNRHRTWLRGELGQWVGEGLIDAAQAEAIHARYPATESAWGRGILSSLGAILIGLGVILLFAYNWAEMHKYAKLSVVLLGVAGAHGLGLWLRETGRGLAGEGLNALGTMLFGAGIWLVAQIYHMDSHYPNAFLLWGGGALVLAWALGSLTQALMAVALVCAWQAMEVFGFRHVTHSAPWLLLLGVFPLVWRLRSRVLAGAAAGALLVSLSLTTVGLDEDVFATVLVFSAAACVALGRLAAGLPGLRLPEAEGPFALPGLIAYLAVLYLLTFPGAVDGLLRPDFSGHLVIPYYAASAGVALALWGTLLARRTPGAPWRLNDLLLGVGLVLVLALSLAGARVGGWLVAGLFNLLFLGHAVGMIIEGSRRVRLREVVMGGLLFTLLAVTRYVDLFESLIARSVVFFAVGGALFLAGNLYSRERDRRREPS